MANNIRLPGITTEYKAAVALIELVGAGNLRLADGELAYKIQDQWIHSKKLQHRLFLRDYGVALGPWLQCRYKWNNVRYMLELIYL